jgi:hypothetical protein
MTGTSWDRRKFVSLALGAVSGMFGLRSSFRSAAPDGDAQLHLIRVLALGLLPGDRAKRVGWEYLHLHPNDPIGLELSRTLLVETEQPGRNRPPEAAEFRRRVAAAVRSDFRNGRMVQVKGWHLATTEARLCAIVAQEG